jgi:hypothetical protein
VSCYGRPLSSEEIAKVVELLRSSDLSMIEISERMGCSRSDVASINRKNCLRYYNGRRSIWAKATALTPE